MTENLIIGYNPKFPENYSTASVFEIGAGDEFYPHSGYIIDNSMTITHNAMTVQGGDKNNINMIKGWRVIAQAKYDNKPYTDGIIIYINKEDFETTPDIFSINMKLSLIDISQVIPSSQILIDNTEDEEKNIYVINGNEQGYEIRISFSPALSNAPNTITGIFLEETPTAGPITMYGQYGMISGLHTIRPLGDFGWSLGNESQANGPYSFAHGESSGAYGYCSFVQGQNNISVGKFSHGIGIETQALGNGSYASGYKSKAMGASSQSIGHSSEAIEDFSIAIGKGALAKNNISVALGEYNTADSPNSVLEVGIGEATKRKTGFYVSRNGLCYAPETKIDDLISQGEKALITKQYHDYKLEETQEEILNIKEELLEHTDTLVSETNNKLAQIKNYPIEFGYEDTQEGATGTICHWHWEKWSNGTAICWGLEEQRNVSCTETWGSGMYKTSTCWQFFPTGLFIQPPTFFDIRPTNSDPYILIPGHGYSITDYKNPDTSDAMTTKRVGKFVMLRCSAQDSIKWNTSFHAIGRWRKQYVTFEPMGGIFSTNGSILKPTNTTIELLQNTDTAPKLTDNNIPFKVGHTFTGWFDRKEEMVYTQKGEVVTNAASGKTLTYFKKDAQKNMIWKYGEDVTFYAGWTPNILSITYNANGGTVVNCEVQNTFYYNRLDSNNNIIHSSDSTEQTPYQQKWTYNNQKETGLVNTSSFGLTKKGYKFVGWSANKGGAGVVYDQNDTTIKPKQLNEDITIKNCNLTLYAIWEKEE